MSTKFPWAKVWHDWWGAPEYVGLDADALGLLALIANIANQDTERRWLLDPAGGPLDIHAIGARHRLTHARTSRAVGQLVNAGVLEVRSDRAWGLTLAFKARWPDESSSAPRVRRHRAAKAAAREAESVTDAVTVTVTVTPSLSDPLPSGEVYNSQTAHGAVTPPVCEADPPDGEQTAEDARAAADEARRLFHLRLAGPPRAGAGPAPPPPPVHRGETSIVYDADGQGGALRVDVARAARRREPYVARLPRRTTSPRQLAIAPPGLTQRA